MDSRDQMTWRILCKISIHLCSREVTTIGAPKSYCLYPKSNTEGHFWPSFGEDSKVSQARGLYNGTSISVKPILEGKLECWKQASILKWLDHPHIVPCLGVSNCDERFPCLVNLWMENGSILEYIKICPKAEPLKLVSC